MFFSCARIEHRGIIANKDLNDSISEFIRKHPSKNYAIIEDSIGNHREILISTCWEFDPDFCDYLYRKGDTIVSYYNLSHRGHGIINTEHWKNYKPKQIAENDEIIHNADYEPHYRRWCVIENGSVIRFRSDIGLRFRFESFVKNKELARILTRFCRENGEKITYVRLFREKEKLYAIIGQSSKYNEIIKSIYIVNNGKFFVVYLQNHEDVKQLFDTKCFETFRTEDDLMCRFENTHNFLRTDRKIVQIKGDNLFYISDSENLRITFQEYRWRKAFKTDITK